MGDCLGRDRFEVDVIEGREDDAIEQILVTVAGAVGQRLALDLPGGQPPGRVFTHRRRLLVTVCLAVGGGGPVAVRDEATLVNEPRFGVCSGREGVRSAVTIGETSLCLTTVRIGVARPVASTW